MEKSQINKVEKNYTLPYYISHEAFQANQALFVTSELRTDERVHVSVKCLWENKIAKEGQPLLQ